MRGAVVIGGLLLLAVLPAAATAGVAAGTAPADSFVIAGGDTLWLAAPVVVRGAPVPAALPVTGREPLVLDRRALQDLPLRSPQDGLDLLPEVAVLRRQQFGIQGDLSLRGATYAQAQVLLDGLDVSDAQTGHHALDLPLDAAEIDRLAVVPGPGALLLAPGAAGGSLDVAAREPAAAAGGEAWLAGGEDGTWRGRALLESGDLAVGGASLRGWAAGSRLESDGDRPGTDLDHRHLATRWRLDTGGGDLDLLAGWTRRAFGARDFYAPFPSHERTEALVTRLRWRTRPAHRLVLEHDLLYRRHRDVFTLWRDAPDRYRNDHLTRRGLAAVRARVDAGHGLSLAAAVDGSSEDLHSTGVRDGATGPALGTRTRRRLGAAVEVSGHHGPVRWSAAQRVDGWQGVAARWQRAGGLSVALSPAVSMEVSSGQFVRPPSFTELYYRDPVNAGSPDLRPEHGWSWDAGLALQRPGWRVRWRYFERRERDLVDWTRPAGADTVPWRTRNLGRGLVRGWSQAVTLDLPRGATLELAWTHLVVRRSLPAGWEGKYTLLAPHDQAAARLLLPLPCHLSLGATLRYRAADATGDAVVVDAALHWRRGAWRIALTATNLADTDHAQVPGVPLPGRLVTLGVGWTIH